MPGRLGLRRTPLSIVLLLSLVIGLGASACGSSGGGSSTKTIKVAYQKFGAFTQGDQFFREIKPKFEKAYPGYTMQLLPIQASENDYYTKLSLMMRSPATAPDVVYEDTFLINSDVQAGYLRPLDPYLSKWADWSQFYDSAKAAAASSDGKTYGVPMGTDTRALWYNKELFAKAGLPVPWQPKSWADILSAARQIKSKLPGVVPLNVYSGKPMGEASTMQGFEMLLYGTQNPLYNAQSKKWIAPSPGFQASLGFLQTIYSQGLAPKPSQALDPNFGTAIQGDWLPKAKLAIDLDGSWLPSVWQSGGSSPWPSWSNVMGVAPMPTQQGQSPGATSMSGGWTLAVGSKSANPDMAWNVIRLALNKQNSLRFDLLDSQIAVRKDVAADPSYQTTNPTTKLFTDLVQYTHYRPAFAEYPRVSDAVQVAMESVMTGQASPQQAMQTYTQALTSIVGAGKVAAG